MNKILFILLVILCVTTLQSNAQILETTINKNNSFDANLLLLKHKKRITAAWILLGGGAGLMAIGLLIYEKEKEKNPSAELDILPKGTLSAAIGQTMCIASLPFFISAANQKKKANLILKKETVLVNPITKKHLVSLSCKINL